MKKINNRLVFGILLLAYGTILYKVMGLKDLPMLRVGPIALNFGGTQSGNPNYVPFKTIIPYLFGSAGWLIGGLNVLGNIILLVPIGFLLSKSGDNLNINCYCWLGNCCFCISHKT